MLKFSVFAKNVLVGHSMLESGDAPMGVAFGAFVPTEAYAEIRRECVTNHNDQAGLQLSVQAQPGVAIVCAGVGILDYALELEPPRAEVNVLGIPYPLYGQLFPEHVASYEKRFGQTPSDA